MKKNQKLVITLVLILILAIAAILFFFTKSSGGNVSKVSRKITASQLYSEQEINAAMDAAVNCFQTTFKGCTLTELWYDEQVCAAAADGWARQYNAEEAIVLLSTFDVDASGGDGSFNPNDTYSDWQWILVRSKGGPWELKTWGY